MSERSNHECPETGKHRYASQYHAEQKLESIWLAPDQGSNKRPTRAYLCRCCSKWHLTSAEQRTEINA